MTGKFDYKKEYTDLYLPKESPMLIAVPEMSFIMTDGSGDPQGKEYQNALSCLYALSFTIKMNKMGGKQPDGYFEYVVPPPEGLWWCEDGVFSFTERANWCWTSMIRQPEFVTEEVFLRAKEECIRKKPESDFSGTRLTSFTEGLCVQALHIGSYASEPKTIAQMQEFMSQQGLRDETGAAKKHHEIYLSDPRKTSLDKLKTVLRHPVAKA